MPAARRPGCGRPARRRTRSSRRSSARSGCARYQRPSHSKAEPAGRSVAAPAIGPQHGLVGASRRAHRPGERREQRLLDEAAESALPRHDSRQRHLEQRAHQPLGRGRVDRPVEARPVDHGERRPGNPRARERGPRALWNTSVLRVPATAAAKNAGVARAEAFERQQQRSRVAQATERLDRLGRRCLRRGAEHALRERELLEPQPALAGIPAADPGREPRERGPGRLANRLRCCRLAVPHGLPEGDRGRRRQAAGLGEPHLAQHARRVGIGAPEAAAPGTPPGALRLEHRVERPQRRRRRRRLVRRRARAPGAGARGRAAPASRRGTRAVPRLVRPASAGSARARAGSRPRALASRLGPGAAGHGDTSAAHGEAGAEHGEDCPRSDAGCDAPRRAPRRAPRSVSSSSPARPR